MAGRLAGKTAVVVGAGQTPGETIGNGRATAILFAREGATVLCVDRRLDSAAETVAMIAAEGGKASAYEADITQEAACRAMIASSGAGRSTARVTSEIILRPASGRDESVWVDSVSCRRVSLVSSSGACVVTCTVSLELPTVSLTGRLSAWLVSSVKLCWESANPLADVLTA